MIKLAAFGLALLAAAITAMPALAATALVKARLVGVEAVPANVELDAVWLRTFRIEKVLYGAFADAKVQGTIWSAEPIPNKEYLIVIDDGSGKPELVWEDLVEDGLCLDPKTSKKYGLETALPALQRDYPCTNE